MPSLLTLLIACATSPQPTAAPPVPGPSTPAPQQAQPSAPNAPVPVNPFTVKSVGLECGPNDGVVLRVRATHTQRGDLQLDLPTDSPVGPLPSLWVSTTLNHVSSGPFAASATIHEHSAGHLKADVLIPELAAQPATLSIDADVAEFNDDCG